MLSAMKRKRKMMNRGETSHRSSEAMGKDPILEPKHKIFLSHSGAQKDFVDHLCKALEDRFYYPFFDRCHESLPKGERFPGLIVQAAQQCEMLIVVVSDEYFMSKWPMIELSAFVQAHKEHLESNSSTKGPMILPLFYGLSVDDLKKAMMRKKWFQKWETLAKADPRNLIIVDDWKYALRVLSSFNGLAYDREKEDVAYVEQIVSCVCKSIPSGKRWDDFHVQGKSNICKVIMEKMKGVGVSKEYDVKVVGLHGVGGIGKTTSCEILCNELWSKYEGRVCHIEFPSILPSDSKEFFQKKSKKFFQKVLRDLTRKDVYVISRLNVSQCKDMLRRSLFERRTFLAIDNVLDNQKSIDLAKMMLELPYHKDSLVVVTTRSQSVFGLLRIRGHACLEMPDLGEADAIRLFLQHAARGQQFLEDEEKCDIMTCVSRCYFSKGDGQGRHYHPLALQALGKQLGYLGETPSLWVKHLPRVRDFGSSDQENPVFDILRSGFDKLSEEDQTLFMDLGCFLVFKRRHINTKMLFSIHMKDEGEVSQKLECLKRKGLLEDVDLRSGKVTMHDLYWEFAELEANGSFKNSTSLRKRMWVFIEGGDLFELVCKPKGGCWDKLIRLKIGSLCWSYDDEEGVGPNRSLDGINWDYFSNVQVLQIWEVDCGQGALNLKGLVCLRILELHDVKGIDRIEGLDDLKYLSHITWESEFAHPHSKPHFEGRLPVSLKELRIAGVHLDVGDESCDVVLGSDLFTQCDRLTKLCLDHVEACQLDLSNCQSLESLSLSWIEQVQSVSGLAMHQSSNLQSLEVKYCDDLADIPGVNHLMGLKKFYIECCRKYQESIPLVNFIPCQLQELGWIFSQLRRGLNLSGSNRLKVLDLSWSEELTSLAKLGDLPALHRLNLSHCYSLMRLPNLSKSRDLRELDITRCYALELHEKDIQMLSKLPLLEPLPVIRHEPSWRLDLRRRKALVHQSSNFWDTRSWEPSRAGEWEERDLGPPPIGIGKSGPFSIGTEYGMDSDSMEYGTDSDSTTDTDLMEYGTDSRLTESTLAPTPIEIGLFGPFSIGTNSGTNSSLTELQLFM